MVSPSGTNTFHGNALRFLPQRCARRPLPFRRRVARPFSAEPVRRGASAGRSFAAKLSSMSTMRACGRDWMGRRSAWCRAPRLRRKRRCFACSSSHSAGLSGGHLADFQSPNVWQLRRPRPAGGQRRLGDDPAGSLLFRPHHGICSLQLGRGGRDRFPPANSPPKRSTILSSTTAWLRAFACVHAVADQRGQIRRQPDHLSHGATFRRSRSVSRLRFQFARPELPPPTIRRKPSI